MIEAKETVVGSLGATKQSLKGTTNVSSIYNSEYELPIASETTLGGVMVGDNLNIDEYGVLNATGVTSYNELTDTPTKLSEFENDLDIVANESDPTVPDWVKEITQEQIQKWTGGSMTKLSGSVEIDDLAQGVYISDSDDTMLYLGENQDENGYVRKGSLIVVSWVDESRKSVTVIGYQGGLYRMMCFPATRHIGYEYWITENTIEDYLPKNLSELENDVGYLTEIPNEYVTESELINKGYLTEHQDISHLATKEELHTHENKDVLDSITQEKIDSWVSGTNNVVISSDEPTNGEEIWLKEGKNLCNTNGITSGYKLDSSGNQINDFSYWGVTDYIEVEPNTVYTLSGIGYGESSRYHVWYDANKTIISTIQRFLPTVASKTYTSPTNAKYIRFTLFLGETGNETPDERTTFQIEKGAVATEYEPYTNEKDIFVKGFDGKYERFYDKYPVEISGSGGITEESDPTVPAHVKAITQADITKWNSGTGSVETESNEIISLKSAETLNISANSVYQYFKMETVSQIGNSFSIENGNLKIGSGVSKVLISFTASLSWVATSGNKYVRVERDGEALAMCKKYIAKGSTVADFIGMSPVMIDVQEGDILKLGAYGTKDDNYVEGQVYLVVQKVNETNVISGGSDVDLTDYALKEEIKTVNGISLIGKGNIVIESGSSGNVDDTTGQTELVVFGDSWSDLAVTDSIWSSKVANGLNLNLHNYAVNGAGFVKPTTNLISTQIQTFINSDVNKNSVKYIVLMGGINDYRNSVAYNVLAPAVISAINTLKSACPKAKILFSNNIEYDYELTQYNYWKNLNNSIRNEVLVATYNMYGLYGNNLFNSNNYFHLTQEGQKLLAKNIMACLSGGELISSIDERSFETSDGSVAIRSELASSNMAIVDLRFVPKVAKTSYTISFSSSLPKIPYATSIQMLGKIDKGFNQLLCDVMDRSVAFASSNNLIVNNVYTFSIITPLY